MNNEEVAVALKGHEHEIGSLKHRMDAVERSQEALNKIATSVEVMTVQQKTMGDTMEGIQKDVTAIGSKVDALEAKPGKRWESLIGYALSALVGAFVLWLASGMPGVAG